MLRTAQFRKLPIHAPSKLLTRLPAASVHVRESHMKKGPKCANKVYVQSLMEKMEEVVPRRRKFVEHILKEHGNCSLGQVTVDMVIVPLRRVQFFGC